MSKPMEIDFAVDVPSKRSGEEVQRVAAQRGFRPTLHFDETDQRWTCYCAKQMVPTYEAVIAAQKELDELSAAFGGFSDIHVTLCDAGQQPASFVQRTEA